MVINWGSGDINIRRGVNLFFKRRSYWGFRWYIVRIRIKFIDLG